MLRSGDIYFQHYKNRPPFDRDDYKLQLLERLNNIQGVAISKDKISKRPNFDLILLEQESEMQKFIDAFDWFYRQYGK